MKAPQKRQYDQYFDITSLDDIVSQKKGRLNDLKTLAAKEENYKEVKVAKDDLDADLLAGSTAMVDDKELESIKDFFDVICKELDLRKVLTANAKQHYGGDSRDPFCLQTFDGDYLRRVFKLLLREHNREDLVTSVERMSLVR